MECIKKNAKVTNLFQAWREKFLWNTPCNNILFANLDLLRLVHNSFMSPQQKYMNYKDGLTFMMKDLQMT